MHAFQDVFRRKRTDLSRLVERIANFQFAHALHELLKKSVVNFVGDRKPLRCDARLSAVNGARFDCSFERRFEIRTWHHNERIAATQLEHALFDLPRSNARDFAPGFFTAGKRHRFDAWIDNHLFDLFGFNQ